VRGIGAGGGDALLVIEKVETKNGFKLLVFDGEIPDYRDVYSGDRTLLNGGVNADTVATVRKLASVYGGFVMDGDLDEENWEAIRFLV
jgi:hypothetical protein